MPVLFPNVKISTARPARSGTSSSSPAAYLTDVLATVTGSEGQGFGQTTSGKGFAGNSGTVSDSYSFIVASGTDIAIGDVITSVTHIVTGLTWPGDLASTHVTWVVEMVHESEPPFLPSRHIKAKRVVGGGKTHA